MKSMKRGTRRSATAKVIASRMRQVEDYRQGRWDDVVSDRWAVRGRLRSASMMGHGHCDCRDCWDRSGKAYKRVPVGQRPWANAA